MNEDHQTKTERHTIEHYEDEIALIDILLVIWKWKYLILIGTTLCGLLAAIISFNMSKIYSVDMVLRPGILSIDKQGQNVYIDTPQNIKTLIESGTFNNDILDFLKNNSAGNIPKILQFKVSIPKNSDVIKVQYETSDIKQGIDLQNRLNKLLLENYRKFVHYFMNEYDVELNSLKSEAESIKNIKIQSYKRNVKNIEKRINELTSEIELIKSNTTNLNKEKKKLLSNNPEEKNVLSALLYSNNIQQNLELSVSYKNKINEYRIKKEEELRKIDSSENVMAKKIDKIKSLQLKKDNIQNIQILKPPTSSPNPIKPKTKFIVILALVAGLFLMLFLAFFLEYLNKYKSRMH
jgi:uncharacterized protein involved in exopolysaccharide biosynthesis